MKRIITFGALLLCVAMLFASCSIDMSAKKFYEGYEYEDTYPTIQSAQLISQLSDLDYYTTHEELMVFKTQGTYKETKFYNVELDRFVLSVSADDLVTYYLRTVCSSSFIFIISEEETKNDTTYSLNVYTASGHKLASKDISYSADDFALDDFITESADLFEFNGTKYRVNEDGSASILFSNPFFGDLPTDLVKTKQYYYKLSSDSVTVYDHSFEQVLYWAIPYSSYEKAQMFILSEEKILVQLIDKLPDTEEKYVFLDSYGTKYDLTSIIIDVGSSREKKVTLDFIVGDIYYSSNVVYNDVEDLQIPEKIDNFAEIHYIKNHKLHETKGTYAALSGKNAYVKFEIAPEFDTIPYMVAKDRYVYASDSGDAYLLDSEFAIISRINGLNNADARNESYILIGSKIYNYDLSIVYDLENNDEELVRFMAHGFITSKEVYGETQYTLHTSNGNTISIRDYVSSNKQFYFTRSYNSWKQSYTYNVYNENGVSITSISNADENTSTIYIAEDYSFYIVRMSVDGDYEYYKFSK